MNDVLYRAVIVLNKQWVAVNSVSVQQAISQMAAGAAFGLDMENLDVIRPVTWEEWLSLSPLDDSEVIHTQHLKIRQPTVIVAHNYGGFPMRRPKLNLRGIAERDGWICQYSGKKLSPKQASIDHVVPRSRGGRDSWENMVLADREINHKKGNRLNDEAGLRLSKKPSSPKPSPVAATLKPKHPHHAVFLQTQQA